MEAGAARPRRARIAGHRRLRGPLARREARPPQPPALPRQQRPLPRGPRDEEGDAADASRRSRDVLRECSRRTGTSSGFLRMEDGTSSPSGGSRSRRTASPAPIEIVAARDDAELQSFAIDDKGEKAALVWNVAGDTRLAFEDLLRRKVLAGPKLPGDLVSGLTWSRDGTQPRHDRVGRRRLRPTSSYSKKSSLPLSSLLPHHRQPAPRRRPLVARLPRIAQVSPPTTASRSPAGSTGRGARRGRGRSSSRSTAAPRGRKSRRSAPTTRRSSRRASPSSRRTCAARRASGSAS